MHCNISPARLEHIISVHYKRRDICPGTTERGPTRSQRWLSIWRTHVSRLLRQATSEDKLEVPPDEYGGTSNKVVVFASTMAFYQVAHKDTSLKGAFNTYHSTNIAVHLFAHTIPFETVGGDKDQGGYEGDA